MSNHRNVSIIATAGVAAVLLVVSPASGQCELARLTGAGTTGGRFGTAVAVDGDLAAVGEPDDAGAGGVGAAYVFERDEGGPDAWGLLATIAAADGAVLDRFGLALAMSGDTLVVGAPSDDDACPGDPFCNSGAVYVFERNAGGADAWGQVAKLTAPSAAAGDWYGRRVAIDGGRLLVGVQQPPSESVGAGMVLVYERVGGVWTVDAVLTASDGASGDEFGFALDLEGDRAIVGARFAAGGGAAYVFRRTGGSWTEVARLADPAGAAGDELGHDVALDGDTAVVGSRRAARGTFEDAGTALVFERDLGGAENWGLRATPAAPDGSPVDWFGFSVAAADGLAVSGAPGDDDAGTDAGAVHLYARDEGGPDAWGHAGKRRPLGAGADATAGVSVATDGQLLLFGANHEDDDAGAAYLIDLAGRDCNGNGVCDALDDDPALEIDCNENGVPDLCDLGDGTSRDCNGNGIPDECDIVGGACDIDANGILDECQITYDLFDFVEITDVAQGGGAHDVIPLSISEGVLDIAGAVTGYRVIDGKRRAFYWTQPGGLADVHPPGAIESWGTGVTSGEVVGVLTTNSGQTRGFIWRQSPPPAVPTFELLPPPGDEVGTTGDTNNATFIIGTSGPDPVGQFWTPDQLNPPSWYSNALSGLNGGTFSIPQAINLGGGCLFLDDCVGVLVASWIVGIDGRDPGGGTAMFWMQPVPNGLWTEHAFGALPGGTASRANGIFVGQGVLTTAGTAVGSARKPGTGDDHAVGWTAISEQIPPLEFDVAIHDYGALGGVGRSAELNAMNDLLAVGWSETLAGVRHGVVVRSPVGDQHLETWQMRDVNHLLVGPEGLEIVEITDVDVLRNMTAWGVFPDAAAGPSAARRHGYLLFPAPPSADPCPWDLDGDGQVGFSDLLYILSRFGPVVDDPGDFDCDSQIGFSDLLAVLSHWGPCP